MRTGRTTGPARRRRPGQHHQRLVRAHLARRAPSARQVVPQRQHQLGPADHRRAAAAVPPAPVGEAAQGPLTAGSGTRFAPRSTARRTGTRRPQLTAEAPRVEPGHLDPGGDHAGRHGIGVQDGAYGARSSKPRSGKANVEVPTGLPGVDPQHPLKVPPISRRSPSVPRCLHPSAIFMRFLDEGLDDCVLGHGLDHLAPDEDLPLAVARRHPEIGLAGLPGPLTTQPITATRSGTSIPVSPAVTSSASL